MNENMGSIENISSEKPAYSLLDIGFAAFALIIGFLFIKLVLAGGLGLGTTIFFVLLLTGTVIYLKKQHIKFTPRGIFHLVVLCLFSLVFVLFDNWLLKFLNLIFLTIAIPLWVYFTCIKNHKILSMFFFDMIRAQIVLPFRKFGACFSALFSGKRKNRKSGKNIAMILGGLCIAFPITAIITALLMSDPMFKSIFNSIFDSFFYDFGVNLKVFIFQFAVGIPVGCYLFGMLHANANKFPTFSDEASENFLDGMKIIPTLVTCTAVTPVCLIYLLFFFSQTAYFLSAFQGILPQAMTYAEYARQGFFDLCIVSVLNLLIITTMQLFCKSDSRGEKPKALCGYTLFLSAATIILIITALSKMFMYINVYGLTQLRVYTSWFMILLFIVFFCIGIKQLAKHLPLAKILVTTFTLMFFVLQFGCIDYFIADYNVDQYLEHRIEDFDSGYDSSAQAIPYQKLPPKESESYYCNQARRSWQDLREWNVTKYIAHKTALECRDKMEVQ